MTECDGCKKDSGFLKGILYGLLPHCGCVLFILFTVLGVTTASAFLMPLLKNSSFFYGLIVLSFVFATVSAFFYLKKRKAFSIEGIKKNYIYLLILYGTVILVNLLLFLVIFPKVANLNSGGDVAGVSDIKSELTLEVDIPCSGHAFLVVGDVSKQEGVFEVKYRFPNLFDISYNSEKISVEEILLTEIFEEFEAIVN
jgi:hypothetical protein